MNECVEKRISVSVLENELSPYKQRLLNEIKELDEKISKLSAMVYKYENNLLDFTPNCPIEVLERQLCHMTNYLRVLYERKNIELKENK